MIYLHRDFEADVEEVTFDHPEVKKIFYGSFHKVLMRRRPQPCKMTQFLLSDESGSVLLTFAHLCGFAHAEILMTAVVCARIKHALLNRFLLACANLLKKNA